MANKSTITVRILGNAKDAIDEVNQLSTRLVGLGKVGVGVAAGLGAIAVGAVVGLAKVGQQFNDLENTIIKGTGATGDALEGLVDEAKDVLATVPDSSQVVAGALADVNTFFAQTGDQLENTTRSFLDFARVTDVELNAAISGADAILTQFGESADDLDETLGDLTRISQATGAPMAALLGQLETFGPIFANAGFSIEQTAAIFGQLEQAGVDVTRIGPALNKFFRDVADAGGDPQTALQETVAAIRDADTATEALNLASGAFGAEGAQRLTNAIRTGNFDLEDFNGLLGEGAGLVGAQATELETLGDKFNRFKNKALVGIEPLASAVFDGFESALDSLEPYIDDFQVWFEANLPTYIGAAQAALDRIVPVIRSVVTAVAGFVSAFRTGQTQDEGTFFETLALKARDLFDFLDENLPPVIEVIVTAFQAVSDWVEENWPQIEATITQVLTAVQTAIETFITIVAALWEEFGDDILALVVRSWEAIGPVIQGAVDIVTGILDAFSALFSGDWGALWEAVQQIVSGAWTIISTLVSTALDALIIIIGGLLEALGTILSEAWDGIVDGVSGLGGRIASAAVGIFDGVKDAFRDAINFIIDKWNDLSFSVPSVDLGPLGSYGGQTISTPNIPRLATGGALFDPRLVIAGDNPNAYRDPEIVAPQSYIREALTDVLDGRPGSAITIEQITVVDRPLTAELADIEALYGSAA